MSQTTTLLKNQPPVTSELEFGALKTVQWFKSNSAMQDVTQYLTTHTANIRQYVIFKYIFMLIEVSYFSSSYSML